MEKSKVYFTDMRARNGIGLLDKLETLIKRAGLETIDFDRKFVAIKIHFGELGNLAFLRPNFARRVADSIKSLGGMPFLTDCNTLYVGSRKNAIDHMETAERNGFSPITTGCQVIIADGLKGTDDALVPLSGTRYVKQAKIGRAIMDADIVVSLNHFKGHEMTGFGGALKNLGMGSGSRAGKMEQHRNGKPEVNRLACRRCRGCRGICAQNAISYDDKGYACIDVKKCVGCGRCIGVCNFDAIFNPNSGSNDELNMKMAEYAKAVVDGRPSFHISIVNQVSPYCDCHAENDVPIIPDVGMFASFDPVALDMACADMVNKQPVMCGSRLEQNGHAEGNDHFKDNHPSTDWRVCLRHAEKIGVGRMDYELVEVK
ncbi:MAG: DUF362 domain-containing protein [Rickettsiales bacterium]|jgi:uncharacterized Fe-S center protein|nr:DUF362 domain-containing protein [Rickettsiales bacterium]